MYIIERVKSVSGCLLSKKTTQTNNNKMADPQSSNSNKDMIDNNNNTLLLFRHSFAAALAEALRENDAHAAAAKAAAAAAPPKTRDERLQRAHATYQWLCHDEPIGGVGGGGVDSNEQRMTLTMAIDCDCLREALLMAPLPLSTTTCSISSSTAIHSSSNSKKQYALSHRLVNGLHQVLLLLSAPQQQQQQQQQQHDDDKDDVAGKEHFQKKKKKNDEPDESEPPQPQQPTESSLSLLHPPSTTTIQQQSSSSSSAATATTRRAMAKLAWSVHLQIPWLCLQESSSSSSSSSASAAANDDDNDDKKTVIAQWLGSYRASFGQEQNEHNILQSNRTVNESRQQQQQQEQQQQPQQHSSSSILQKKDEAGNDIDLLPADSTNDNNKNHQHQDDNKDDDNDKDSLQEVWAAESDPSDYEFDSGLDYQAQLQELDQWATQLQKSVDPHYLSQPPSSPFMNDNDDDNDDVDDQNDWKILAQTVGHLLQSVSYSPHLVALPTEEWKAVDMFWMPLILTLLVPTGATAAGAASHCHHHHPNALLNAMPTTYWQHTGLHILHVLRDATLDGLNNSSSNNNNGKDYDIDDDDNSNSRLMGYVHVLQQLLQVQMAQEDENVMNKNGNKVHAAMATTTATIMTTTCSSSSSSSNSHVAPASWIGLSLFSALCSTVVSSAEASTTSTRNVSLKTIRQLQTSVLESCDDLSLLLERSLSNTCRQVRTALQWTYLSFFQILLLQGGANSNLSMMNANTAQTLLQSGLFRQWLLHWAKQQQQQAQAQQEADDKNDDSSMDTILVQRAVQDCVLKVCAANPSLLGKYAWRFPNFAATVTAPPERLNATSNAIDAYSVLVDELLWNLLGIQLADNSGMTLSLRSVQSKGKLGLNGSATSKFAPSVEECRQTAWAAFQELCQQTHSVLSEWRNDTEKSALPQGVDVSTTNDNVDAHADKQSRESTARPVTEFGRLVYSLMENPLLGNLFMSQMVPSVGGKLPRTMIESCLQPILRVLRHKWPTAVSADAASKVKADDDEADDSIGVHDNDDLQQEKLISSRNALRNQAVSALRRDIKQLTTMLLDSGTPGRATSGGARVAYIPSSKAD